VLLLQWQQQTTAAQPRRRLLEAVKIKDFNSFMILKAAFQTASA